MGLRSEPIRLHGRSEIPVMSPREERASQQGPRPTSGRDEDLGWLLARVARGDETAFEAAYDHLARPVFGLILKVLRDPAQSEEVAQEVLVEIWRTASRFDASRGSAMAWVATIAHRRAIDRVRSAHAQTLRDHRAAAIVPPAPDGVAETVESRLDAERVRRCLTSLTELQRESVTLAYYGGYTHAEVAALLGAALGTIKTRIRDGLIRMRDCLGVSW